MGALELAHRYIEIFFFEENLDELYRIFSYDLSFSGPFYTFDTASDYIDSLKSAPPKNCTYKMIKSYEDNSSACLVYEFSKPGVNTTMTQIFEVKNDQITKIKLFFDTTGFN